MGDLQAEGQTQISSKDQTLQRAGDQMLEGFTQDRVQQRVVELNILPEMIEQLVEVPKTMSQKGIQRRTAEQIVGLQLLSSWSEFLRGSVNRAGLSR